MIIKSLARGGRVRGGRCRWMAADERRRVVAETCIFDRITQLEHLLWILYNLFLERTGCGIILFRLLFSNETMKMESVVVVLSTIHFGLENVMGLLRP